MTMVLLQDFLDLEILSQKFHNFPEFFNICTNPDCIT